MSGSEAAVTSAEISPISEPETAAVMAEEVLPPSEATEVADDPSPAVEVASSSETAAVVEDPSPAKEVAPASEAATVAEAPMAAEEERVAPAVTVGSSETDEIPASAPDHKRKLEDLDQPGDAEEALKENQDASVPIAPSEEGSDSSVEKAPETLAPIPCADAAPAKRQRLDGETDGYASTGEQEVQNLEAPVVGNGQYSSAENTQQVALDNLNASNTAVPQQGGVPSAGEQPPLQDPVMARKLEVPNNKVGVLIGKSGETIKILQHSSGVKIQITRDNEADPNSSTRPVELIGTLESINKAEQLIKAVIAEADAGGSPALVARGFGNAQSGSEQQEIRVPNEKVGMIIGKGGETIKSLQTRSGARIQLIPQHLPDGDVSKERTVRITGNKKQIEAAKEMIKEVMNQVPVKHSALSGGYIQRNFRPRGPSPLSQWGGHAPTPTQPATGYDYQQRGMYPSQNTQYPPQPYGSYTQPPPRSSNSAVWGQRAAAPIQSGGYNSYGQGGRTIDNQTNHAPSPAPVNYNYGQPQVAGYGQTASYTQTAPTQQNYGHGYNEQKYDSQVPSQQFYGQQPMNSQPGAAYTQQGGTPQADYAQQQPYSKPAYDGAPPSYGPPRTSQPGDAMYQGAVPSSYGSVGPTQQSYPYGQSAPTQPAAAYGQTYGPTSGQADGYTQPSSASGYPQQTGQVAAYAQGGQPASAYPQQGTQSGGYGQYPSSQPSYGDQPVPNNVSYGYQGGPADAGYGGNNIPSSGYGSAPVTNQAGYGPAVYGQAGSYPSGYEQSVPPQSGYGSQPGSAPVGYTKGLSPQPGYGGQYDSAQMYGHP